MLVKLQQDGCSCLPLLQFCFKLAYTLQTLWLGFFVHILVAQLTLSIYVHANKTRLECVVGILTMCMCICEPYNSRIVSQVKPLQASIQLSLWAAADSVEHGLSFATW